MTRSPADRKSARRACLAVLLSACILLPAIAGITAEPVADADSPSAADLQDVAQRELAKARAAVAEARAAAMSAKNELERAARDAQKAPAPAAPQQSADGPEPASAADSELNDEIARIEQSVEDLEAERTRLLTQVTTAHPLIVDADLRLDEYRKDLTKLRSEAAAKSVATASRQTRKPIAESAPPALPSAAERRLDDALAKWETAGSALQAAIDAESNAVERLAGIADKQRAVEAAPPTVAAAAPAAPSHDVAALPPVKAAPVAEQTAEERPGSQPLVLAALAIALIVAAWASIKLARASDETVFAGAEDAASVLALPVVGAIPTLAGFRSGSTLRQRHPTATFLVQVLVAVVVFAAVAYFVQNPSMLWPLGE
jgi:hypothetical protein